MDVRLDLLAQSIAAGNPLIESLNALWMILKYSPYWAPPVLAVAFWRAWMRYVRASFIASQPMVLLEVKMPAEVYKSPRAMQYALEGMHIPSGESTFIDRILKGKVRTWFSLEIVSTEGQVHFYVWTRAAYRRHVERMLYAQYPELEIQEVPDYTTALDATLDTHDWNGIDYELKLPDPLPIKTYVDLQLDQTNVKEEQKTDPLVNIIELAGSMGKGEHLWIQIIIRPHKAEDITTGQPARLRNTIAFDKQADKFVSKIRQSPEERIVFADGKEGRSLSQKQLDQIKAVNRTVLGCSAYDAGVRVMYLAEQNVFDGTTIPAIIRMFLPFSSVASNQLAPVFNRWLMKFDFPWQDYKGMRENKTKVQVLDAYRRRSWFHPPYQFKHCILTTEEIATLFHPVGSVAKTPTMQRITSTRAEAPANLPL